MPPYELITYMTRPEPSRIGPPERHIPLPPEIKILTYYNSWLMDGLWETKVIETCPNGRNSLIGSCATLEPPDRQHGVVVDFYRKRGYKVVGDREPLTDAQLQGLEKLLEGIPGLG